MRVLISAYACEPGKGSEPYVGWNLPVHLARHHELWLLTRANNRTVVDAELRKAPVPNLHVVYLDLPRWARFWKKGSRGIHAYYYLWQIAAYFTAKRLHRQIHFEVTHHVTFGIDWLPSFLAFLPIPFVWGPIIGAQPVSTPFRRTFSLRAKAQESIRACVRRFSRLDPMMRLTARRTAIAVASGLYLKNQLSSLGCKKVLTYPSVGISKTELDDLLQSSVQNGSSNEKVRFLCVGNLYAFRALSLTLDAFARISPDFPNLELWIVGDGPERPRLIQQSQRLGTEAIRFWSSMPRGDLLKMLSICDAFVYPCLRGAISMAVLEAMAAGLPVICLDLGGTALQVDDNSGIRVRAISPAQVTSDLAEAMCRLSDDESLRRRMGDAGRRRVQSEFSWDAKALHLSEMYRQARTASDWA